MYVRINLPENRDAGGSAVVLLLATTLVGRCQNLDGLFLMAGVSFAPEFWSWYCGIWEGGGEIGLWDFTVITGALSLVGSW